MQRSRSVFWAGAAATWAGAVAYYMYFVGFGRVQRTVAPGQPPAPSQMAGLRETDGPSALIPLAVPIVLSLIAMLLVSRLPHAGRAAIALAWLALAFCVVASMSIGLFFLPTAILLFVAARAARRPDPLATVGGPANERP